jgi:error-prone DNA polymerase
MPDPAWPRRPRNAALGEPRRSPDEQPRYVELHCRTNFTFLEGASHPDELVATAQSLGIQALAVTDINTLAGVVRAHAAAKEAGLPLIIGAEIVCRDAPPLLLWVTDRAAYGRLARLLTVGRRRAKKGQCELTFDDLAAHAEGLIAGLLVTARDAVSPRDVHRFREVFGTSLYGVVELHRGPNDREQLERAVALGRATGLPLVAAGDVHYHTPDRQRLHDVLTAVRHQCTVAEAGEHRLPNGWRHLKSPRQMGSLFARHPTLIARTLEIAQRCRFSLDELRYEYPEELCPPGITIQEYLAQLTWQGAARRFPDGVPERIRGMIEHELKLIEELNYEAYFLTVWDLVCYAQNKGILCQGRGSAANSVVCYCLGVTSVNPDKIDLLFERFISRERNEAPDIDVDFEHQRREEVLQYIYEKYGRDRAGMTAVVITYRPRSAVRDVGKALGLSPDLIDATAKLLGYGIVSPEELIKRCQEAGWNPASEIGQQFVQLVCDLIGFPRHLSQHVGGMVMTRGPLCELVPIENAAMDGRTVIQWDKDDLDVLGILKVDILALGMLSAIRRAFALIEHHEGTPLTLAAIPQDDAAVYDMICRAETVGVFQIESRAQMTMLPRLQPRCFYDLVIEVAIVRPGPIQGKMVHPYLRRRTGEEDVTYPNDAIREVLKKTLGVPLFQEQAMRLAVVAAGFTPGEADQLRRAMAAWRRPGLIEQFRQKLLQGMLSRGLDQDFAERVYQQIQGFGKYGFPESHAASFALLAYVSAWLKWHHPAVFAAALMNSQPMGFYAPAQIVREIRDRGVEVRPVDVNASGWDCRLEPKLDASASTEVRSTPETNRYALRLGFRQVRGLAEVHGRQLEVACRDGGPFASWQDFVRRSALPRGALVRLARADAFGAFGLSRRESLWRMLGTEPDLPLFLGLDDDDADVSLPAMSLGEEVVTDYSTGGLSLKAHPISLLRDRLVALGIRPCSDLKTLPHQRFVQTAGLVLFRQRPSTAKGITFMTIEDETGIANLVVHPNTWERFHKVARMSNTLLVEGRLERHETIIHVIVSRMEDLSQKLGGLRSTSRDFR